MAGIVVSEFMTVDGVIEDPGGAEGSAHGGHSPVLLGSGKRLFSVAGGVSDVELVDTTKAGETLILTIHPARAMTAQSSENQADMTGEGGRMT